MRFDENMEMTHVVQLRDLEKGSFFQLLDEFASPDTHHFQYLTIDAARISSDETVLADSECLARVSGYRNTNNHVQRLTLSGFEKITREQFAKITQQFPQAIYFDLRGSGLEEGLIEGFTKKYILEWGSELDSQNNIGCHHKYFWDKAR